jgi:peptidoglycan/xylan/chitin deacetylase (PgdA/CDA1 family)
VSERPSSPFRVALTFDAEHPDRPTSEGVHEQVLSILDRRAVRATFFLQGRWVQAYPDLARAVPSMGHLVGNHSFYHARMPLLSRAGLETDVRRAERVIRDTVRVDPAPWFRLPFGSGDSERHIHASLAGLGYRHVGWDADGREWRRRLRRGEVEDEIVRATLERGDGAIVLMHSWPRPIPEALEGVITRLRDAKPAASIARSRSRTSDG